MLSNLHILAVEDSPSDLLILRESLRQISSAGYELLSAATLTNAMQLLQRGDFDLVLLDLGLPDSTGLETFKKLHQQHPQVAIIVLTGMRSDDLGIQAVRMGAQDYLVKDDISSGVLGHVLRYSLERHRLEQALAQSEREYRLLFERHPSAMWVLDRNHLTIQEVNRATIARYGYSRHEWLEREFIDCFAPEQRPAVQRQLRCDAPAADGAVIWRQICSDGSEVEVELLSEHIQFQRQDALLVLAHDVTSQLQARRDLLKLNLTLEQRVTERSAEATSRATQLQRLARQLTKVEENERRKLAYALHENLQQTLVAARMQADGIAQGRLASAEAAHVKDLLSEALSVCRSVTMELAPPMIYEGGLPLMMTWLVGRMEARHQLRVSVRLPKQPIQLELEDRVLLFQVARELLFNIVKHARTSAASLEIQAAGHRVYLMVEDQGAGFDPACISQSVDTDHGFGLFSLKERVGLQGGELQIDAAIGRGSKITCILPLQQPAPSTSEAHAPASPSGDSAGVAGQQLVKGQKAPQP